MIHTVVFCAIIHTAVFRVLMTLVFGKVVVAVCTRGLCERALSTGLYDLLCHWVLDSEFVNLGHVEITAAVKEQVELSESRNVAEGGRRVSN
jgi:hypothetical protein